MSPPDAAIFAAVTAADARLERIGIALASANADICTDRMAATGIVLRSLREYQPAYRAQATDALDFTTPVVIEAIIPGTPAAKAGLRAGDGLLRADGHPFPIAMPEFDQPASLADLDAAQQLLEAIPANAPVEFQIRRDAKTTAVTLAPVPACRSRFAVMLDDRSESDSDGLTVRIGAKLIERLSEAGLAVVVAHELAHTILKHPAELERLKVRQGLGAEFGRSARETLRTEDEADRLSVHLLARAGYDPMSVAAFWRGEGHALLGFLPRGPSHRGWSGRAALAEQEAKRLLDGAVQSPGTGEAPPPTGS